MTPGAEMSVAASSKRPLVSIGRRLPQLLQFATASLLFLGTAWVGVWAAYDPVMAWQRFLLLAMAVLLALTVTVAGRGEGSLAMLGLCAAVLAGFAGGYFLFGHDWDDFASSGFAVLPILGSWMQAYRPASMSLHPLHANAAGGALAILVPLGTVGIYGMWRQRQWLGVTVATLGIMPGLGMLILSSSRGAWVGLGAGLVVATLYWLLLRTRQTQTAGSSPWLWLLPALLGSLPLLVLILVHPLSPLADLAPLAALQSADPSVSGRLGIWRNMLTVIEDYSYTGSGLSSTEMVYSSYVLLLHVGYFTHAHNLFLQIAVEQGIPGMLAFVWLIGLGVAAVTRYRRIDRGLLFYPLAMLASLTALLVHGVFDSEFYVSELAPLILLPVGMALVTDRILLKQESTTSGQKVPPASITPIVFSFALPSLLLAMAVLLPAPVAAYYANLGAVSQTRAELSVYQWPEWPVQDAVRRAPEVDLNQSLVYYSHSLAMQPNNVTANRRLGQIALSRGNYPVACEHLEKAHAATIHQLVTQRLLGECYAAMGEIEKAAQLWRNVKTNRQQLQLRQWWYHHIDEESVAARLELTAELSGR
jgi:O-antigen ligase